VAVSGQCNAERVKRLQGDHGSLLFFGFGFRFSLGAVFPSFISSCCFGRWRKSAPISRLVASRSSGRFAMTNPVQEFRDARSKVKWAERHIYKLIDEYNALLKRDLAGLTIESYADTRRQVVTFGPAAEFPPAIPLIVGDAVHNLRTAFDYIIVAITGEERLALPVGKKRSDVEGTRYYGTIKCRFPELASFIIETIQPYHRGQFLLWELSELDRIDKHRLILKTRGEAHRLNVELENEGGKIIKTYFSAYPGKPSVKMIDSAGPLKVKHQGHSAISVSFGPGTPLNGEPVLEALDKFSKFALKAIEAFERFHFRNR
jgi:hypothetical protein